MNSESLTVMINNLVLPTEPTQPTKIKANPKVKSVVPNNVANNNNQINVGGAEKISIKRMITVSIVVPTWKPKYDPIATPIIVW
ncbi:Uncharacterised protein, partial [Mycoplasmopsis edwardii]